MKQSHLGRCGADAPEDKAAAAAPLTPATLPHGTLTLNKAIIIEFSLNEEDGGK